MNEDDLEKVDEFLFQFVKPRFRDIGTLSFSKKILYNHLMLLIRAFIRCLYNSNGTIFLKDIAFITRAEALYMSNEALFDIGTKAYSFSLYNQKLEDIIDIEIHRWMLYLAENNKLPPGSEYNRFMEKFVKN